MVTREESRRKRPSIHEVTVALEKKNPFSKVVSDMEQRENRD